MIADTMESLRPKMNIFTTAEEAYKAAEQLENEYRGKIGKLQEGTPLQSILGVHAIMGPSCFAHNPIPY